MKAHTCNPRYSGVRDKKIMVQGKQEQKVSKTSSQKPSWVWYSISIIPAAKEMEVGGLWCLRQKHMTLFLKTH
jgi:hypothetical protein